MFYKNMLLKTSLIIFLLYIWSVIIYIVKYNNIINKYQFLDIDTAYNIAETGDLILFKYEIEDLIDVQIQGRSAFSHCGMVLEINNQKYVLETSEKYDDEAYCNNSGPCLSQFHNRINKYNGRVCLLKKRYPFQKVHYDRLIQNLNNYMKIKFRDKYINEVYNTCILNKKNKSDEMHCSEFISYILTDIGILNISKTICMTPFKLFYLDLYDKNMIYRIK